MLEAPPATEGPERQLPRSDQKFAEPVALSSTQPTDRPLARRASRLSLDLIALRARRTEHPMRSEEVGQVVSLDGPNAVDHTASTGCGPRDRCGPARFKTSSATPNPIESP
jgi:hypothetical protein